MHLIAYNIRISDISTPAKSMNENRRKMRRGARTLIGAARFAPDQIFAKTI